MSTQNKTAIPNSLNEHWMPFTSNKDFKENPRLIVEAKGVYLKNHQGQTQIAASSGLFCNPLGHGRDEIIEAITNQLKTLDYCQPFQQGFGGSFELATRISKHTPGNLNRMFYTYGKNDAYELTNGKEIKLDCSKKTKKEFVKVVSYSNKIKPEIEKVHNLLGVNEFVRMKSSYKFCVIATGEYDGYVAEPRACEWDIAAGHALLENAGGTITDFEGNEILYGKEDFRNPSLILKRSEDLKY